jgi:hypothetical protein
MSMIYVREYLHVVWVHMGARNGWGEKNHVFLNFSWDFEGWNFHLYKIEYFSDPRLTKKHKISL